MTWKNTQTRTSTAEAKRWARAVKARDRFKCVTCGYQGTDGKGDVQADHRQPVAEGGQQYDPANGQTLCTPCHKVKTAEETARGLARTGRKLPPEQHPGTITPPTSHAETPTIQPKYTYAMPWDDPSRSTTDPRISAYGPTGKP